MSIMISIKTFINLGEHSFMHYPFVLDYLQVVCTLKRLHLIDDGLFLDHDELLNLTACYSYF